MGSFVSRARQHVRTNPKAKARLRGLTRTRFITDMGKDVPLAAWASGMPVESFDSWLAHDAEEAFSTLPALGRVREVVHMRPPTPDDPWEQNDLNDLLYLSSAAGYAHVVVCERKMCNYLLRAQPHVPDGARVFSKLVDAVLVIEELCSSGEPRKRLKSQ